ncbi:MAG: hypothetical protein ACREF3_12480, partial [Acetobacteraceae bacterium]
AAFSQKRIGFVGTTSLCASVGDGASILDVPRPGGPRYALRTMTIRYEKRLGYVHRMRVASWRKPFLSAYGPSFALCVRRTVGLDGLVIERVVCHAVSAFPQLDLKRNELFFNKPQI